MRLAANRAFGIAGDFEFIHLGSASIPKQHTPHQRLSKAYQYLNGLGCLHGANNAHQWRKDSHRRAAHFFKAFIG